MLKQPMREPDLNQRALLRTLFDAAVAAADPMLVIPPALPPRPIGRLLVIGAGKASARMAEAVEERWGPCPGLVITRYGHGRPCRGIEIVEAGHPVPDQAGVAATNRMLDMVSGLDESDFVLALISGGGSALLSAPAPGVALAEKQALIRALLQSGAPIGEINAVRKQLSAVKGGRLAAAAWPARMLALLISDVPGDDPADIASGPTVGDPGTGAEALAILERHRIAAPPSILAALSEDRPQIRPRDPRLARAETRIIAAPSRSLAAAADLARREGIRPVILGDAIEGEAREVGAAHARDALARQRGSAPTLLLSGGELTVTHGVEKSGSGGPNAEYALAAAIALDGAPCIHLIACDTDGIDGAAEIAGAIVTPDTLARAEAAEIDADAALARHDSHGFFQALGDSVVTGPTLTNVNDFRAILIEAG